MVATSQPLATQAGLRALERGGNAIDAALAAAASLTVTLPDNVALGGDRVLDDHGSDCGGAELLGVGVSHGE